MKMQQPTREQVREGRDEALEHLGVSGEKWEAMTSRRGWLKEQARMSDVHLAAAMTIAQAEHALTDLPERLHWSLLGITLGLMRVEQLTRDDFALQA